MTGRTLSDDTQEEIQHLVDLGRLVARAAGDCRLTPTRKALLQNAAGAIVDLAAHIEEAATV